MPILRLRVQMTKIEERPSDVILPDDLRHVPFLRKQIHAATQCRPCGGDRLDERLHVPTGCCLATFLNWRSSRRPGERSGTAARHAVEVIATDVRCHFDSIARTIGDNRIATVSAVAAVVPGGRDFKTARASRSRSGDMV